MRQAKEDNRRTKLVREIPYIDSKTLIFILKCYDVNRTLQYNGFAELSSSFDVICLTETKTDHKDELHR